LAFDIKFKEINVYNSSAIDIITKIGEEAKQYDRIFENGRYEVISISTDDICATVPLNYIGEVLFFIGYGYRSSSYVFALRRKNN